MVHLRDMKSQQQQQQGAPQLHSKRDTQIGTRLAQQVQTYHLKLGSNICCSLDTIAVSYKDMRPVIVATKGCKDVHVEP